MAPFFTKGVSQTCFSFLNHPVQVFFLHAVRVHVGESFSPAFGEEGWEVTDFGEARKEPRELSE